jgi:uncharacterized membrane protein
MTKLIPLLLGLVIFLGMHSFSRRRMARANLIASKGEAFYKMFYSLVSLLGLALIVYGYGFYHSQGMIPVWDPPRWMGHVSTLLMWASFILLAATYLPGKIKAKAKHPMLAAVKIWAVAHLLANGDLGSILLFGSFLAWAVYARIAVKKATLLERVQGSLATEGSTRNDLIAVAVGTAATVAFVLWLHTLLIGVAIVGR